MTEPGIPAHVLDEVARCTDRIAAASAAVGRGVVLDGHAVLTERARLEDLPAPGRTSSGGRCHLLPCADGWVAVSLARSADLDAVPAWLAVAGAPGVPAPVDLPTLARVVSGLPGTALVEAAALLGLPVGRLGERTADATGGVTRHDLGQRAPAAGRRPRVVDLTALWAGPLCAAVLADTGADVVVVEDGARPDAARHGSPSLHHRLRHATARRCLDLRSPSGRATLHSLVGEADIVLTAARGRALAGLDLLPARWLQGDDGPAVWVSITGHGLAVDRVAFGDDAAVAGGLVATGEDGPRFCGDAIADPLSGLAAAAHALEALTAGRRVLLDVAMAGVAAAHTAPVPSA